MVLVLQFSCFWSLKMYMWGAGTHCLYTCFSYVFTWASGGQRLSGTFISLNLEFTNSAGPCGQPVSFRDLPASASSALVLQVCAAALGSFCGCWGSKLRSWGLSSQHVINWTFSPAPKNSLSKNHSLVCKQNNRVPSAQKIIHRSITVVQPVTFPNSFISCSHVEILY